MARPAQKRRAVEGVVAAGLYSQRRACRYLGHRSTGRYQPKEPTEWLLLLQQENQTIFFFTFDDLLSKPEPFFAVAENDSRFLAAIVA